MQRFQKKIASLLMIAALTPACSSDSATAPGTTGGSVGGGALGSTGGLKNTGGKPGLGSGGIGSLGAPAMSTGGSPSGSGGALSGVGGAGAGGGHSLDPALHLTLTLHLENKTFDAAYFASLNAFAQKFEAHGGKLTFEPRDPVVKAASGPPALQDWKALEARGHSVGSHAGIGGVDATPLDTFTAQATLRYTQLAPQVTRLDHVSGNCGNVDWVKGVIDAGFKATTATTVLCLYSMAPADRPAEYQALNCNGATDPTCHSSYPTAVAERIHPWRALSGAQWLTDDPNGKLVIFPGSGSLPCLEEEATSTGQSLPTCTLTQEDVTRALSDLDAAILARDSARLNTFYWVWGSWSLTSGEEPVLEALLSAIDTRVQEGKVKWANLSDMLDAYEAWEATR